MPVGNNVTSTKLIQGNVVDVNNSSIANVNAGAFFTGASTSTIGYNGILTTLKTDQNCTVYVDQSQDNVNWDVYDKFDYYASINNFGVVTQAVGAYFRVRVQNISASNTTYFRLQAQISPVTSPLPRSLSNEGFLEVAIQSIADDYGFEVENTPMGEMRTIQPVRIVGAEFDGSTIDTNYWTPTVANSATVAQTNSEITLSSGTNAAGSAKFASAKRGRYISGSSMRYRCSIQLSDTGTANNTRQWGIAYGATMPTITDGAYFQLSGTTFSIVVQKGGVATVINSGSFNVKIGAVYAPTTDSTTYELYWIHGSVYFIIGNLLLHKFSAPTTTWTNTVTQYIYYSNFNSGNTTNVTIKSRNASIYRLGSLVSQPISVYQAGTTAGVVAKYGAGSLHSVAISGIVTTSVVTLYDNTAASGTVLWSSGSQTIGAQANNFPYYIDFKGLAFTNGLTLVISTANCNALVIYE